MPDPARPAPSTRALLVAGAALIAWNALNLVPFPAAAYVPANLGLAVAAVVLARRAGLGWAELGLRGGWRRGLVIGLGCAALVGTVLLVARRVPAAAPFLADERAAGLSGLALVYGTAIRIPFGTAVPEEIIFRGVLLAALRRRSAWWPAVLWSSAVFGLWHIGPTIVLARVNALDTSALATAAVVAGAVATTTAAGVGFCLLRRWGGGVLAPVLAHTATNSLSLLAATAVP
jgi:membrane protease YdiL (CAAX protease family)